MTMSTGNSQPSAAPAKKLTDSNKKEVKILMLHGYTQSGPLFRSKTRAMEKLVAKSLSPFNLLPVLFYPTAPIRLSPSDIPGYCPPEGGDADEPEAYAWFRKDEASGTYRHLSEGMEALAKAVEDVGGVDGVVGFSQGGAVAAMMAAALEGSRQIPSEHESWAQRLRAANAGRELKFSVVYSGFWSPPESLQWLYEPKVRTPSLHYLGSLDSVVVESRSLALVERCVDPVVVTHPGGHYVPVSREWVNPIIGFLRDKMAEPKEEKVGGCELAALG